MSVYSYKTKKGKQWRYEFVHLGVRQTGAGFPTKREAIDAEAARRLEVKSPQGERGTADTPTDMDFLELVNERLQFMETRRSHRHFKETLYLARRWPKEWKQLPCSEIRREMIEQFVQRRSRDVSAHTANKEIRYLRATFNFGIKRGWVSNDPTKGVEWFPVERRVRRVPTAEDVNSVIAAADPNVKDYLWAICDTMARVNEIDRLTWADVDFGGNSIILYTRKKRGGNLTPRRVPMTRRLRGIMERIYCERDRSKEWVFWHRYWSRKSNCFVEGPYSQRKRLMKQLCRKAAVEPFGFHGLRHFGASVLDGQGVPIGAIQRILGHENRTTTEIYLHSIGTVERQAMEIYESATEWEVPHGVPHERERGYTATV